ncbi:MAG: MotA/TolQ/ExbB proton channel family protein [Myxococcales bacterium]|nr:MotA/TolQ/ExbB proton channel family protein [Myxococcales bacterium]
MQIVGLILLTVVIAFGFTERQMTKVSAFDLHALVIVSGGSFAAIMVSSSVRTVWHTLLCLRELLPIPGPLEAGTARLEDARRRFVVLWREGKRAQAVEVAERSGLPAIERMLELVLGRAGKETVDAAYLELRHAELGRWQPPTTNWELLARLGPSFGLVGTVTGIVVLFRNMGNDNLNIGAAMSLALVSTLYGIAFGAGIAGPMGHYLRGLVDERLGALARCQQSTVELIERGVGEPGVGRGA